MKITPLDIRRKEFKRSVRGYSDEEVDIFLDEIADEFERLFQENMELQDRAQRLDEQIAGHVQVKDALEKTLVTAQLQSEEIRANAHKEGELILRDAELKARGIVNDSYGETQKVQQTLVQLKRLEEDFRFKFRSLLEGYLNLLHDEPITAAGAEAAVVEASASGAMPALAPAMASAAMPASGTDLASPPAPAARTESAPAPVRPPVASRPAPAASPEEAPTKETEPVVVQAPRAAIAAEGETARTDVRVAGAEEVTAESAPGVAKAPDAEESQQEAEAPRRFFFGRQMEDADDTFPGEDGLKKDKARDFEW